MSMFKDKNTGRHGICYAMLMTFTILASLFESIEEIDQTSHIQEKQNFRLHTTLCKRLDLDILLLKIFHCGLNLCLKKKTVYVFKNEKTNIVSDNIIFVCGPLYF